MEVDDMYNETQPEEQDGSVSMDNIFDIFLLWENETLGCAISAFFLSHTFVK